MVLLTAEPPLTREATHCGDGMFLPTGWHGLRQGLLRCLLLSGVCASAGERVFKQSTAGMAASAGPQAVPEQWVIGRAYSG